MQKPLALQAHELSYYVANTWHEYASETREIEIGNTRRVRLLYNGGGLFRVCLDDETIYTGETAENAVSAFHEGKW
jgi:hypothetical protein